LKRRAKRTRQAPTATAATNLPDDQAQDDQTAAGERATDDQIGLRNLSLHDLFEQQARNMLDRADIEEEDKQRILIAMSCPCCGAGSMSFTAKLKK